MIIAVHHYELPDSATPELFESAVATAEDENLFSLPGLVHYRFLRGIKGEHVDSYAALWYYESRDAWEQLWGPVDDPIPKSEYPQRWKRWEDEYLAPVLAEDPDGITYTSYRVIDSESCGH